MHQITNLTIYVQDFFEKKLQTVFKYTKEDLNKWSIYLHLYLYKVFVDTRTQYIKNDVIFPQTGLQITCNSTYI